MSERDETTTEYLRRKEREGVRPRKPTIWEECDASPLPALTKLVISGFLFIICGMPCLLAAAEILKASTR